MSMYDKNHYNIVISLQLIKINEKKKCCDKYFPMCFACFQTHETHDSACTPVLTKVRNRTTLIFSINLSGCREKNSYDYSFIATVG